MGKGFAFLGSDAGAWRVRSIMAARGEALPAASHLDVQPAGSPTANRQAAWTLHGVMSNLRYATQNEVTSLRAVQEGLGRPQARLAALIPIKKSQAWWDLAQDERRSIFEAQPQHTAIGLTFLPAIARQLYHSRDLGEPFDFLTWFEFAPEHTGAFEDLVGGLRATHEWSFVEREIDIRLQRSM